MKVTPELRMTDAMTPDGAELITDGTFAVAANWTLGTGWAIASSALTHTSGQSAEASQSAAWIENDLHTVEITISGRTAGAVDFGLGEFLADTSIGAQSANGSFSFKNIRGGAGGLSRFDPSTNTFDGDVEIISVKKEFSNVPEDDFAEYAIGTAYTAGTKIMIATGYADIHNNYECLVGNTGKYPPDNTAAAIGQEAIDDGAIVYWDDLGPTNRWAMFDGKNGSQTVYADVVTVDITPGVVVNSFAAVNISANTVQLIMTDPVAGEVFNQTVDLQSFVGVSGMYAWLFSPIERESSLIIENLPPYINASIKTIYTKTGGTVRVGSQVVGYQETLGVADHGTSLGLINFSRKKQDIEGNYILDEKGFKRRATYAVSVTPEQLSNTEAVLSSTLNTPAVWVGEGAIAPSIVFGYYTDHNTILVSPVLYNLTIEVEGLIQ